MVHYRTIVTLLLFIFACSDIRHSTSLTFGIDEFPSELDPVKSPGIYDIQILAQIYETLVRLDADYHTLVPHLAESWAVSADYQSYTFRLRDSVYFHDGSVLRADDVHYSFLRRINENKSSFLAKIVNSVEILDSMTVKVNLSYPNYQFLFALASPFNLFIVSGNLAQQKYNEQSSIAIGTGPYQLTEWKDDDLIILSSFPDYWQGESALKYIFFSAFQDVYLREQLLEKEQVDILYLVTGYMIDRLKWKGAIDYCVKQPVSITFLGFNNTTKPFNDIRVRRAVLKALNLPKIVVNLLRGNALTAQGPLPPCFLKNENLHQEAYNVEEAKTLLKQAGYEDGLKVKFYFPMIGFTRQTIIEMIRSELGKVGISLDVKLFDSWEDHDQAIKSDSAQMFIDSYGSDVLGDAQQFLYSLFHSKSSTNSLHYAHDNVDEWLDEACREEDAQVRQGIYAKVVQQVLQDVPAVFLFHVIPHFAYNRRKIKKMVVNPYQIIQFHNIELYE